MKVSVTPEDNHRLLHGQEPYLDHGKTITGKRMTVTKDGVWIDGKHVITRDTRPSHLRTTGHRWLAPDNTPTGVEPRAWTGFQIEVQP